MNEFDKIQIAVNTVHGLLKISLSVYSQEDEIGKLAYFIVIAPQHQGDFDVVSFPLTKGKIGLFTQAQGSYYMEMTRQLLAKEENFSKQNTIGEDLENIGKAVRSKI